MPLRRSAPPVRPHSLGALSIDQTQAALILARGGTVSAAADAIGVHRATIYNWFKNDAGFQQAVEEIRRERSGRLKDVMRELDALALARLRHILEDVAVPPAVQLRAALAVLGRSQSHAGDEDWNVPRMESLNATLLRRPDAAVPPEFDTTRQISALLTDFGGDAHALAAAPQPLSSSSTSPLGRE